MIKKIKHKKRYGGKKGHAYINTCNTHMYTRKYYVGIKVKGDAKGEKG